VTTRTYIQWALGDNLMFLNFLRKVARAYPDRTFIHHALNQHLTQLRDVVEDVPNIKLEEHTHMTPTDALCAWIGADRYWYSHANRNDFVVFYLDWFARLANQMQVKNPIRDVENMLFDYPAILKPVPPAFNGYFDVLVVNSAPGSGQFSEFNAYAMAALANEIAAKGRKVISTAPVPPGETASVLSTTTESLSVTQIGQLSLHCPTILMVATGPGWPTFNVWNQESVKTRIIFLTEQWVNLSPNTHHCRSIAEASPILKQHGLL
jgi:hypothetical protein